MDLCCQEEYNIFVGYVLTVLAIVAPVFTVLKPVEVINYSYSNE